MLRSLSELEGYVLLAHDGDIGRCRDFLFDDHEWKVRHMVADTGKWLSGREVLVRADQLGDPDWPAKRLPVLLTRAELEGAPGLEEERGPPARSFEEVSGYTIRATDDTVGHVEDLVIDEDDWSIRYLVVDTRDWLPGRKVLVAPHWIERFDWSEGVAVLDLTREQIEASPEYEPKQPIRRAYEAELHEGYGREGYWDD